MIFFLSLKVYSYWEWTPKTKRWINPKYAVKETPKEQFEYAENLRKEGKIELCIREHKKLLKYYNTSEYAPISYYILGEIFYEKKDFKKSFDYYQKVIERYPSSPIVLEALKKQIKIAEEELEKPKSFLRFFSREEEKGWYMSKVINNYPYDIEIVDKFLKLAEFYSNVKNYEKAIEVLNEMIKNFPNTFLIEKAKFLKIKYKYLFFSGTLSDIDELEFLKEEIEDFLKEFPESNYRKEIESLIQKINEVQAKKYYEIALYYERSGNKNGAEFYYKKIIQKFPNTYYGKIANKKININQ